MWVGSADGEYAIGWEAFEKIADFEYWPHSNTTGIDVPADLIIVGEDWWLERHEYDCSEWWEYKTLPTKGMAPGSFDTIDMRTVRQSTETLKELCLAKREQDLYLGQRIRHKEKGFEATVNIVTSVYFVCQDDYGAPHNIRKTDAELVEAPEDESDK